MLRLKVGGEIDLGATLSLKVLSFVNLSFLHVGRVPDEAVFDICHFCQK